MKYLLTIAAFLLPVFVIAAEKTYQPLVGLPGLSDPSTDFDAYINTLYAMSISIAALLAVFKIIIAGVKWMMTDVVTSKEDAKKDIKGALIGLLIVLGAVLILTVINPNLVKVNLDLKPPPTATLNSNEAIAPYTKNPGDKVINTSFSPTPAEAKEFCELRDSSDCESRLESCYFGEYIEEDTDGQDKCLIRKEKLIKDGDSVDCDLVAATETTSSSWDCEAAKNKCASVDLVGDDGWGILPSYVNCEYP